MLFINDSRRLVPLALLLFSAMAQAQDPVISEVTVDNDGALQITIKGKALSTGSDAVVSLGNVGTLSVDSQTAIDVVASAVSPVPVGDYLLTLTTTLGTVAYDLTIGAAETGRTFYSPGRLVESPAVTAVGLGALANNTTGSANSASGTFALASNTTGHHNTGSGAWALLYNTTGSFNTASGTDALRSNTEGSNNSAFGRSALYNNTEGFNNTASGVNALFSNTTGALNTATGLNALYNNTTGVRNTASGVYALFGNTSGHDNTASGVQALAFNTGGYQNTASGGYSLHANTTGDNNTATGFGALGRDTTGDENTASGAYSLANNTTGGGNIALGYRAGSKFTTGSNNIAIGNEGVASESETIRIGDSQTRAYVAGINGNDKSTGKPVFVSADGQLGTGTYVVGGPGPAGGVVFYVTADGLHGLEVAPADMGNTVWGCADNDIPGAEGSGSGAGAANTEDIVQACETGGIAARWATDYVSPSGYFDWYLPSFAELKMIWNNLSGGETGWPGNARDFQQGFYWSSTEVNSFSAYRWVLARQDPSFGKACAMSQCQLWPKASGGFVRAVRAF